MTTRFLLSPKYKKIGWLLFIPFSILGAIGLFSNGSFDLDWLDARVPALLNGEFQLFSNGESNVGLQLISMIDNNLTNEILGVLTLLGCVFLTFSREKDEDEYIAQMRLESLLWATFVNCILLFLALALFYDMNFFYAMVFNLYSLMILFIVHFNIRLRKIKRGLE